MQKFEYAEDAGAEAFRKDIAIMEAGLKKLEAQEQKYAAELDKVLAEYAELKAQAADFDPVELYKARQVLRPAQEKTAEAERWLLRACAEAPQLREPWLSAAGLALEPEKWSGARYFAERALEIPARSRSYLNEPESWGARPYDLAALAAYYMGLYATALSYGREALAQEPENGRLQKNLEFYEAAAAKM